MLIFLILDAYCGLMLPLTREKNLRQIWVFLLIGWKHVFVSRSGYLGNWLIMYEGILWDYGVTASVPPFVRSNALWSIAFIVHNLSPRVFFSVHLWRSPESFDLWWKKGWSGVKGNPSVIPGYDLTSQPATITMITSSECVQILSTDTFLNSYWLREMKWILGLG